MNNTKRYIALGITLLGVVFLIWLLGGFEGRPDLSDSEIGLNSSNPNILAKQALYPRAREVVNPSGFINVDENFSIAENIGKKVILVDFWTYSCINCQRTQPYLNAWQDKYGDNGLLIVGIHTPEFGFEKVLENVQDAVSEADIEYPVILDNDMGTWDAYQNRYWPHKFLIDIDGFIVYDHIGEGSYSETEEVIQRLLEERAARLDMSADSVPTGIVNPDAETPSGVRSPETYFGAWRNNNFANGVPGTKTEKVYARPGTLQANVFYLEGTWKIEQEYARNTKTDAAVLYKYSAQKVFMVAHSEDGAKIEVILDGKTVTDEYAGSDVENGVVEISTEKLYRLIEADSSGEHTLELRILEGSVDIYTYTFG